MSNSIVGNNGSPSLFDTEYGYGYMDGELLNEQAIFGYRAICPKKSNSTSITISYYNIKLRRVNGTGTGMLVSLILPLFLWFLLQILTGSFPSA